MFLSDFKMGSSFNEDRHVFEVCSCYPSLVFLSFLLSTPLPSLDPFPWQPSTRKTFTSPKKRETGVREISYSTLVTFLWSSTPRRVKSQKGVIITWEVGRKLVYFKIYLNTSSIDSYWNKSIVLIWSVVSSQ